MFCGFGCKFNKNIFSHWFSKFSFPQTHEHVLSYSKGLFKFLFVFNLKAWGPHLILWQRLGAIFTLSKLVHPFLWTNIIALPLPPLLHIPQFQPELSLRLFNELMLRCAHHFVYALIGHKNYTNCHKYSLYMPINTLTNGVVGWTLSSMV